MSGVLYDLVGNLSQLNVIPGDEEFPTVNSLGHWSVRNYGGSFTPEKSLAYRFLGADELDQSNHFTRDDVLAWPRIDEQSVAPEFGFQTAVLAGPDGVSAPIDLQWAYLGTDRINEFAILPLDQSAPANDTPMPARGDLLVVQSDRLLRRDFRSAEVVWDIDISTAMSMDPQPFVLPNEPVTTCGLWVISSEGLDSRIARFETYTEALPDTVIALVVADALREDRLYVFDPESGEPIGRVDTSALPDLLHHHWRTVAETNNGSLFQASVSMQTWRRVSLADMTVTDSGSFNFDAGRLMFEPESEDVILVRRAEGIGDNQSVWRLVDDATSSGSWHFELSHSLGEPISVSPDYLQTAIIEQGETFDPWKSGIDRDPLVHVDFAGTIIESVRGRASVGQPSVVTDDVTTANVGDWIVVEGKGLGGRSPVALEFPTSAVTADHLGQVIIDGTVRVTPDWVDPSGSEAVYRVPENASSGQVNVVHTDESFPLVVVPRVLAPNRWGDSNGPASRYEFTGLAPDRFALLVDDVFAGGCSGFNVMDVGSPVSCDSWVPVSLDATRREHANHSIALITSDGRHEMSWAATRSEEEPAQAIKSLRWTQSDFGTRFVANHHLGTDSDSVVPAGSAVEFDIDPHFFFGDTELDSITFPPAIDIRLQSERPNPVGQMTFQVRARADEETAGRYHLLLPLGFQGGELTVLTIDQDTSKTQTPYPLEILPTAIAHSGDSRIAGETFVLAGINLDRASILIDGVVAEVRADGIIGDETPLPLYFITVPESVTDGNVGLQANDWMAVSA
ncbi:MAG: hypothetical protein AAF745_12075, partial [Planctomycetota bacterium]